MAIERSAVLFIKRYSDVAEKDTTEELKGYKNT
jgi:hypothetical protein